MFRLAEALVDGRLGGGVPDNDLPAGGGKDPVVPSGVAEILARGGGAAEAGRVGPLEA
jgi:hypothetical protein